MHVGTQIGTQACNYGLVWEKQIDSKNVYRRQIVAIDYVNFFCTIKTMVGENDAIRLNLDTKCITIFILRLEKNGKRYIPN